MKSISAVPENGANPEDLASAIETDILFAHTIDFLSIRCNNKLEIYTQLSDLIYVKCRE